MIKSGNGAYAFPEGFEVEDWERLQKKKTFTVFELACYSLGQCPVSVWDFAFIKESDKTNKEVIKVKRLSKLVVSFALSVDDRYTVPANKRSIAGLKILMGAINDAEERLNKGKVKQVKLSMTEKTLRDYMLKAFDEIGIEIRA